MLIAVRAWILLSALLVADGWILSALRALNRTGYAVSFALALVLWLVCWRPRRNQDFVAATACAARKFWHRLKRPAPLLFFLMLLLNAAIGLVQIPNNWDTDAYRIPRVLHWQAAGGWHWIHTADSRMNIAGAGLEWLFSPLILFFGSDRWLFLINIVSFAFLPGLIFALFRRLRMAGRVAWWWTWILSFGWCFAHQACSVINDGMGAVYALAAVLFALCASENGDVRDWWLSVLAVALLTGLKQSNLPLVLPWLVAAWPARRLWWRRPVVTGLVVVFALLISAVTISCLNLKYVGTWSGFPKDIGAHNLTWGRQQELSSPFWGLIGNAFCFPAQNLLPPFFPLAPAWDAAMQRFLHSPAGAHFAQFENFGYLDRSVTAGNAGLGLGVMVLALISVWGGRRYQPLAVPGPRVDVWLWLMRLAPWLSLLAFLAKVGTYQNARQAAPYYVLLFPLVLAAAGQAALVRQRWWRWLALMVMAGTLAHLTFVRGRALVPAAMVKRLQAAHPHSKFLSVFGDYYTAATSVEAQRVFLQTNNLAGEKLVGYATTCGASEPGFWIPFGSRRVERVLIGDAADSLRAQEMHYVVVEQLALTAASQTISQWTESYRGDVVSELVCKLNPAGAPIHLYLVHLRP